MKIGILGGGLTGITLQRFLECDSEILEKESRVGGLCRSFECDGFYYDIGGHILYSRDETFQSFVKDTLKDNTLRQRRNNKVLYKNRYLKYPFENDLGSLEKQDNFECLYTYINNDYPKPSNFLEWIYYTFGRGISEKYLVPYNTKIWKTDLQKMSLEWVERVPKPPMEDVLKSAIGIETEGYVHQLYFNYPENGGIESFVRQIIKNDAKITTNYDITKITKKLDKWCVSNGQAEDEKFYDRLVLTIPIKEAITCFDDVPYGVLNAASNLKHNAVRVVMIGINNESLLDKTAVYIPDPEITPHRICFMGCFSKNNVPFGKSSLIAEVTCQKGSDLYNTSDDHLKERIVNDLDKLGIINKQELVTSDIKNFEYGYVVYDLEYKNNIKIVKDYFEKLGINLCGRFAEFEYINMDEAVKRSMNLAHRLNLELIK